MDGCGGEDYDYSDFIMKIEDIPELQNVNWSVRNKYGERSGAYLENARLSLERMGMGVYRRAIPLF